MAVPNTFATATSAIPLANLDANFTYYDTAFSISGTATTFTGSVTLTSGTANGVTYLNGSKVLTSGSALTFDGTNFATTGTATAAKLIPTGSSATGNGLYLPAANSVGISTNGTNAVYIDSTQNVGIGTSSPNTSFKTTISYNNNAFGGGLYVVNTNTNANAIAAIQIQANNASVSGIQLYQTQAGDGALINYNNSYLSFGTNAAERMRITSAGNVGIGTTSVTSKLDVVSTSGTYAGGIRVNGTTSGNASSGMYIVGCQGTAHYNWLVGSQFNINNGFEITRSTVVNGTTFNSPSLVIDYTGNLLVGTTTPYSASGGGTSKQTVTFDQNGRTQVSITNSNSGSSASAALVLGSYGTDWVVGNGSTANNSGALTFTRNSTEAMRILSTGEVGIGVTNPSSYGKLSTVATAASTAFYAGSSTQGVYISNSTGTDVVYNASGNSAGAHVWQTGNTERMRITSAGDLLVGTTGQPVSGITSRLAVSQPLADYSSIFVSTQSTAANCYGARIQYTAAAPNGSGNAFLVMTDTGGDRAYFKSNGGLANYSANNTNLSDVRTKTDIQDAGSYLSKICAIPVRIFKYKNQTDDLLNLGVIAQEVEDVAPELVDVSGFGETPEDGVPLKAIYQTDLQYALMKSIQELKAIVDAQAVEIAALKGTA